MSLSQNSQFDFLVPFIVKMDKAGNIELRLPPSFKFNVVRALAYFDSPIVRCPSTHITSGRLSNQDVIDYLYERFTRKTPNSTDNIGKGIKTIGRDTGEQ